MSRELKRATGLVVIEVVNSNPNGDPDREADPRQRPNGLGEISPVSFKRKLRDLVDDHKSPVFQSLPEKFREHPEEYCILESRGRDRKAIQKEMETDGDIDVYKRQAQDTSVFPNLIMDAVHKDKGIERGQRTGLPFFHLWKELIGNLADHLCRQFNPIEFLQLVMDIPCTHASCVQRDE